MQIAEKYKGDYSAALKLFRSERARFADKLSKLDGIRLLPSQANYLMLELTSGISAKELTKVLLIEEDLLIKDLSEKIGRSSKEYIRVAIRNTTDNDKLVNALKKHLY